MRQLVSQNTNSMNCQSGGKIKSERRKGLMQNQGREKGDKILEPNQVTGRKQLNMKVGRNRHYMAWGGPKSSSWT